MELNAPTTNPVSLLPLQETIVVSLVDLLGGYSCVVEVCQNTPIKGSLRPTRMASRSAGFRPHQDEMSIEMDNMGPTRVRTSIFAHLSPLDT